MSIMSPISINIGAVCPSRWSNGEHTRIEHREDRVRFSREDHIFYRRPGITVSNREAANAANKPVANVGITAMD